MLRELLKKFDQNFNLLAVRFCKKADSLEPAFALFLSRGEERLCFFALGIAEDFLGCAFFLDDSVRDEDDAVGDVAREFHFVRDDDHRALRVLE